MRTPGFRPLRRRAAISAVISAALLSLCASEPAAAQASRLGDTFDIPYIQAPVRRFPELAFDPTHKVYLTVSGNWFVGGAFVTEDGVPIGPPFQFAPDTTAQTPSVAYSPDADVFLVAWLDTSDSSSVWGRILSYGAGGVPSFLTSPFLISGAQVGCYSESAPAVAYSTGSHEFLVVWHQGVTFRPRQDDIHARRVSTSGALLGAEITVTNDVGLWQTQPGVAYNPQSNEFYVAWSGTAPDGVTATIEGQRVKAGTGELVGARATLASGPFLTLPKVQFNPATGRFFVVWYFEKPRGLYGRLVAPDGSFDGNIIPLNATYFAYDATHHAYNPVANTFFVVTHAGVVDSPEDFGFEVGALGNPSPAFQVTMAAGTGNFYPAIAAHSSRAEWLMITAHSMSTVAGQRVQTATRDPAGGGPPPPPPPPPPPQTTYTLTVQVGSQTQVFPGIPAGSVRSFSADPAAIPAGTAFAGWIGDPDCFDGTVTMVRDLTCTAALDAVLPPQSGAAWRRALDFSGDNAGDFFLLREATGDWYIAHNDTQSSFTYSQGLWTTPNLQVRPARLNADTLTDLVVYSSDTGRWWQAIDNGVGGFAYSTATWGPGWTIYVGRFNRDDLFDDVLVYRPSTGEWAVTFSDGNGGFAHVPVNLFTPPQWDIHIIDFDGDGVSDLFLYNPTTGEWWKGINTGSGAFAWTGHGMWSPNWTVKSADLNGDGRGDIFVYNVNTGYWYWCLSTSAASFEYRAGRWSPGWQIYVANLDRDACDDLFVYNPVTGYWYECFSNGTDGFWYFAEAFVTQPTWQVAVSEFNGDGLSDLFIYDPATGAWHKGINTGTTGFVWSWPARTWTTGLTVIAGR